MRGASAWSSAPLPCVPRASAGSTHSVEDKDASRPFTHTLRTRPAPHHPYTTPTIKMALRMQTKAVAVTRPSESHGPEIPRAWGLWGHQHCTLSTVMP